MCSPDPAPEVVATVRAGLAAAGAAAAVAVGNRLGELFDDAEFTAGFGVRARPAGHRAGWPPAQVAADSERVWAPP